MGEYSVSGTVPASASQPPLASLSANPTSGVAPLAVGFSAAGSSDPDGSIVSDRWNFGDGTSATGATASKTYSTPGTYTATLKVTDNAGLTAVRSVTINVTSTTHDDRDGRHRGNCRSLASRSTLRRTSAGRPRRRQR